MDKRTMEAETTTSQTTMGETAPAEFCAYPSKDIVALIRLNQALREIAAVDLVELQTVYTSEDISKALKTIALFKEYECSPDEIAAALRLRRLHNTTQARYYAKNKEELNRRSTCRIQKARQKAKLEYDSELKRGFKEGIQKVEEAPA